MRENRLFKKTVTLLLTLTAIFNFSFSIFNSISAQTPEEERQQLEQELQALEEKISQYQSNIDSVQKEKKTLQNQITLLQSKINKLNLQIKQGNIQISQIKKQITTTEGKIEETSDKLNDVTKELKTSLRDFYQEDKKGLLEIALAGDLSDFFNNLNNLEVLNSKISKSLGDTKSLKASLEGQKQDLDKEKQDLQKTVEIQALQKQSSLDSKAQQETILEETKGKESLYQQYLTESQKRAAKIRSRIFEIIGVAQAPTFGQAYDIAKMIYRTTGVRPAFLLAVITQESNLGKNVGQCNCKAIPSCKNPGITWKDVMKPGRDWEAFEQIAKDLGKLPENLPVSCPMYIDGKKIGWGGAMGPAQFIPSTWLRYKTRVEQITGRTPADPWKIEDAFLAAALYLKDYGAASQKPADEWRAAMIYFSGTTNTKYRFYGDSVLNIAKDLQDDIDQLENNKLLR